MASRASVSKNIDRLTILYFCILVPCGLLFDAQTVLPASLYQIIGAQWARDLNDWNIKTNNDYLTAEKPAWFRGLVWLEVFVQIPFGIVALYALAKKCRWIRFPLLVYGVMAATVLVPLLSEFALSDRTDFARGVLLGQYLPFFLVPLLMAWNAALHPDFLEQSHARNLEHKED